MRRSPQEKKALSYAKDRRSIYGENDKSSRKNIPLRKRLVNKANRHAMQQQLHQAEGLVDLDRVDLAEVSRARPKVWRKRPDVPLGEYLNGKRGHPPLTVARRTERPGRGR
jgi:hypothetical protein